jgi:CRISPR/Cas system-associated endonuclease Cas1
MLLLVGSLKLRPTIISIMVMRYCERAWLVALCAVGFCLCWAYITAISIMLYCLADDIMEPYRPLVDKWVLDYIETEQLLVEDLGTDEKRHILNLMNIDVEIEQKMSPLMIATQRTTASLMRCFMGEGRKIAYPITPNPPRWGYGLYTSFCS